MTISFCPQYLGSGSSCCQADYRIREIPEDESIGPCLRAFFEVAPKKPSTGDTTAFGRAFVVVWQEVSNSIYQRQSETSSGGHGCKSRNGERQSARWCAITCARLNWSTIFRSE